MQGDYLISQWFTRVGLSSDITLYYQGHIWDLHGYGEKAFFNDEFFGCESLEHIKEYLQTFARHDADISIVVIDRITNQMLVYMSPIWTHSLYVNDFNLVSPSINSLVNIHSKLDYQYLGLIRKFGYNQNDLTPYDNIKRLLPGYMYQGNVYKFFFENTKTMLTDKINTGFMLPLYLEESIINRLSTIEDKTIGVLLSWGLDSSVISALLVKYNEQLPKPKKFRFFTTDNEDDIKYAREVAKFLKIKLEVLPSEDIELTDHELFCSNQTPIDLGSVVPNIKLFKRISSMWIHTIITGDWPDEMFRWYKRNAEDFDYHMHDINNELVYYHFPRLENAARYQGIDLITPYVTPDIWNMVQTFDVKIYKWDLKELAHWLIPESVIERTKEPLKNKDLRKDKQAYQHDFLKRFISYAEQLLWEFTPLIKR